MQRRGKCPEFDIAAPRGLSPAPLAASYYDAAPARGRTSAPTPVTAYRGGPSAEQPEQLSPLRALLFGATQRAAPRPLRGISRSCRIDDLAAFAYHTVRPTIGPRGCKARRAAVTVVQPQRQTRPVASAHLRSGTGGAKTGGVDF